MRRVAVTGAAALAAHGAGWRGLGATLAAGGPLAGMPDEEPLANPRARKMMSRGAYLAAAALRALLREVEWPERGDVGYFLGVGASGGSLDDVTALLDASIIGGELSLPRFGDAGLAACNPLLAFQLMNNFTMCHGAILEGLGGPNGALFSRGAGTTAALVEAVHAIASGDCDRAIAGGADSATHPVTRAELARDGFVGHGLVPAEGAAVLALAAGDGLAGAGCVIDGCAIASGQGRPVVEALDEALARAQQEDSERSGRVFRDEPPPFDLVVIAPWGPPAADALRMWARRSAPEAPVIDTSPLGDSLAATPALAWVAALDRIAAGEARRALVASLGVDGDVGVVVLAGGAA